MHWFEQLSALYNEQDIPLFHTRLLTDILISLSSSGRLLSAAPSRQHAIIPATEVSACRTRNIAPHPLCDTVENLTEAKRRCVYLAYLKQWSDSPYGSKQLNAVLCYIESGRLAADLAQAGITYGPHSVVRFAVDGAELCGNAELIKSHISFTRSLARPEGICSISGSPAVLCARCPRRIISASSSAKLISGLRGGQLIHGRFGGAPQAFTIGQELSFKAHTVLRRLILQGGLRMDRHVFLAFDESGACLPLPLMGKTAEPAGSVTVLCLCEATKGRLSVALYRQLSGERYRLILRKQPRTPLPERHAGCYYERLLSGILI